ncbi:rRNA pseudouridine synthase [Alkanindiges sp. WGS2144]|uniref:rRNA pseudouridine synthase n=1 Tax=Alkanindiges sp. WGS2144 TaxID=3366808 RepID=UPI0037530359
MTTVTNPQRLAKVVSQLRACSRRDAEHYIAGGWVSVDGVVVEQSNYMIENQQVVIASTANLKPILPVTILLNKPAGYDFGLTQELLAQGLSARNKNARPLTPEQEDLFKHDALQLLTVETRAKDDRATIRPLRSHFQKLIATAALESAASGLVVYTQDRRIARKLIDDASRVEQEFIVQVKGSLSAEDLQRLNQGFYVQGKLLPPAKVSWQSEQHLRIALKNVQLNQIETMCQGVGLRVLAMKRIRIGRLAMAKLAIGEWRYLLPYEKF